ncbi:hypothetical protein M2100_001323, partial [Breznakia sp. PFB2-30]|uniref:hypothetical protein n=1 Tax=Breznakia sp. PFB2-30 TaxID=2940526 RepID=UPI0024754CC2
MQTITQTVENLNNLNSTLFILSGYLDALTLLKEQPKELKAFFSSSSFQSSLEKASSSVNELNELLKPMLPV